MGMNEEMTVSPDSSVTVVVEEGDDLCDITADNGYGQTVTVRVNLDEILAMQELLARAARLILNNS